MGDVWVRDNDEWRSRGAVVAPPGSPTEYLPNYVSPGTDTTGTYSPTTAGVVGFLPRYQDDPAWCTAMFAYDPNDPSFTADWTSLVSAIPAGVPTLYSPKGDPSGGSGASAVTSFLNSLTQGWRDQMIWAFFQEPAKDIYDTPQNITLAQYQARLVATANLVRPYGIPNAVHMEEWTLNPFNTTPWGGEDKMLEMTDGVESYIDYYSWSLYPNFNKDATPNIDRIIAFMSTHFPGVPWGVTAAGLPVYDTDPLGGSARVTRANRVLSAAQQIVAGGGKAFGWFDWDGFAATGGDRDQLVIKDGELMAAMQEIATIPVPGGRFP